MKKLRGLLLGVALALPLSVVGASVDQTSTSYMSAPESQSNDKCCWVFWLGLYWCIPCDV